MFFLIGVPVFLPHPPSGSRALDVFVGVVGIVTGAVMLVGALHVMWRDRRR